MIVRHMIPSFLSHIIASATLAIPGMILGETALSFLGLGLRPPVVSWSVMLQGAMNIANMPWLLLPGVAVVITVLAFNFLGDGLRDKKRRIRLEGDVADPANPPSGCYFHPRCRYVQDICKVEVPPLHHIKNRSQDEAGGEHFAACHFAEELNLRGVIAEGSMAAETNQEST
jgi:oligopeptide/dipeptide ABC transporter ATP-binding protein